MVRNVRDYVMSEKMIFKTPVGSTRVLVALGIGVLLGTSITMVVGS